MRGAYHMYHPRSPQRAQVFFMQSLPEPAAGADLKTLNNSLSPPQAPIFFFNFIILGRTVQTACLGPRPAAAGAPLRTGGLGRFLGVRRPKRPKRRGHHHF